MMKKSASDAGISGKNVTNHTARKTMVQTLRNAGFTAENVMEKSGHKNMSSIINYSTISDEEQKKMTSALMEGKVPQPGPSCEMPQCSSTSTGPMFAQHSWVQPQPVTYNHCTIINQPPLSPWQWKVSIPGDILQQLFSDVPVATHTPDE